MEMYKCATDPCVLIKKWENKTELITGINVDDTLVLAKRKRATWFQEEASKRFMITCQEEVKKHLGVKYDWGEDKQGIYTKASMKELKEDMVVCLEEIIGCRHIPEQLW